MGFFGIGTWEILLILVVALIIWGPGKLPEIARTMGKTVRALKKASFDLTTAVTKEIEENDHPASQSKGNPSDKIQKPSSGASEAEAQRGDDQSKNQERHQQ